MVLRGQRRQGGRYGGENNKENSYQGQAFSQNLVQPILLTFFFLRTPDGLYIFFTLDSNPHFAEIVGGSVASGILLLVIIIVVVTCCSEKIRNKVFPFSNRKQIAVSGS